MSLQKNLGITLKALRAEKGVSQEKLALSTGIDRRYMSDIENGRRNVSLEIVEKLAAFFEMKVSEFIQRIELNESSTKKTNRGNVLCPKIDYQRTITTKMNRMSSRENAKKICMVLLR